MARTKQVFPYNELARVWLRQGQGTGKSPGDRMYFTGATIYSYGSHFPLARITTAPNGEAVILYTTRTWSNTTATHKDAVWNAIRNSHRRIVYCSDITAIPHTEDENLRTFRADMETQVKAHDKARKPELYAPEIKNQARLAREYCEVMCLPVPAWAMLPDNIEAGAPLKAALKLYTSAAAKCVA